MIMHYRLSAFMPQMLIIMPPAGIEQKYRFIITIPILLTQLLQGDQGGAAFRGDRNTLGASD